MRITFAALAAIALASLTSAQTNAAADYSYLPTMPGAWGYFPVAGGSEARFVDTAGMARVTLHCTMASRQVTISASSPVSATTLFVWTTSTSRTLPARFVPTALRVSAELAARDNLLDAIAFTRGSFAVQLPAKAAVVVPASPEAARAVEDCRN